MRARLIGVAVPFTAFVLLTVLVALDTTQGVDEGVREVFRPDDAWGTLQVRVDLVVEGLKPVRAVPAFTALALVVAAVRRSWLPLLYAASLLALAGTTALVVKVALGRTDPHHELSSVGSYPSGHTLVLLVCLGGSLVLLRRKAAAWEWLLVWLVVAAMAISLLLQAAHWFTDVLAGVLLGVAVLAAVPVPGRATPAARPAAQPGSRPARPRSAAGPPSR